MGLLRRNNYFWDLFARAFGINWFYGGEIYLSSGDYKVIIHTDHPIKNVWINMTEPEDSIPVCCGDVSMIGTRIHKNYVEINAKIRTDVVTLNYFLKF